MIHHQSVSKGFTLLETIMYLGLFGLLFAGILASAHPFLSGTQRIMQKVATENDSVFVLWKMKAHIANAQTITLPLEGDSSDTLTITTYAGDTYTFTVVDNAMTLSTNDGTALPITAERVTVTNFSVRHAPSFNGMPAYLEYSFSADGENIGPIHTYAKN